MHMAFAVSISVEVYSPPITTLPSLPDFYVTYCFGWPECAAGVHFRQGGPSACPEFLVVCQLELVLISERFRGQRMGDSRGRGRCEMTALHPWHEPHQLQSDSPRTYVRLCYLSSPAPQRSLELSKKNISFPAFFLPLCSFIPYASCAKPGSCVSASGEGT